MKRELIFDFAAVSLLICAGALLVLVGRLRQAVMTRMECRMNLGQLGVALRNYHDIYGCFIAGTLPNESLPPEKRISWHFKIWPYCEGAVMPQFDETESWDSEKNRQVSPDVILFHCPASGKMRIPGFASSTSYVGIAGVGRDAPLLPREDPRAGIFGYERSASLSDIKDGTSTTMMLAETAWNNGPWTAGGPATVRGLDPQGPPYVGKHGQFGGKHGDGAFVLFADGSVRFLIDSISPHVFESLATIAGGEDIADALDEQTKEAWWLQR